MNNLFEVNNKNMTFLLSDILRQRKRQKENLCQSTEISRLSANLEKN